MAQVRFLANLKRRWLAHRKRRPHLVAGFTLLELLVSMVIATIITIGLLSLVVELTDANQKDAARTETQRDMQMALNYIAQDLREAVFVYDGDCMRGYLTITNPAQFANACPGLANHIPAVMTSANTNGASYTPVLAFWRTDLLPADLQAACRAAATALASSTPASVQGVPCISGRSYTLVVYGIAREVNPAAANRTWQGRARLVRYQLAQFTADPNDGATQNVGYVDPLTSPNSKFQQWPYQNVSNAITNAQGSRPTGSPDVLVDFLDDKIVAAADPAKPVCPTPSVITPTETGSDVRSFFACVRGKTSANPLSTEQGVNQEVMISLTGNVSGRAGFPISAGSANTARLFPIQTRVLVRGIVGKNPGS